MARGPRRSARRRRRITVTEAAPPSPEAGHLSPETQDPLMCNNVLELGNGQPVTANSSTRSSVVPAPAPFLASSSSTPFPFPFHPIPPDTTFRIFSGTANSALSQGIASHLGLRLGKINIRRFASGEIYVKLKKSVRGCDVYLVQPTCPPTNENLMELLLMIDACRRGSAKYITAVIPYFGYARVDYKIRGRESIGASLVANLISNAGANRVIACDLHPGMSKEFFDIPVDDIYGGQHVICDYLRKKKIRDLVVVYAGAKGETRARYFAEELKEAPLAYFEERQQVMILTGDVKGKVALMVGDMIDTAVTMSKGAALLQKEGAREIYACSTHAVFSPQAKERLSSGSFKEVIVTNTIPVSDENVFPELTILTVAELLANKILHTHDECTGAFGPYPSTRID